MSLGVKCPKCESEKWTPNGFRDVKFGRMRRVVCECGYGYSFPEEFNQPNILFLDIETAPINGDVWSLWKQDIGINQIRSNGYVLCVCGNMNGEILETALPNFPKAYRRDNENDLEVVTEVWEWLDQADIVIGHNVWDFDLKTLNGRFLYYGLLPPSPYKIFDTLKTARSKFRLPSNKLDYLAKFLKVGEKIKTGGHELWTGCREGDLNAWDKMIEYCHNDVVILEKVYHKLLPWATNHPNMALYSNERCCKNCGSKDLTEIEKTAKTNVNEFKAYRCDKCGTLLRERKTIKGHDALTSIL